MIKRYALIVTIGIVIIVMISSCGREAPAPWPWWTSQDSSSVKLVLAQWSSTLNGFNFIRGQNNMQINYPLQSSVPLIHSDTISRNGLPLVKIANFLGFYNALQDSVYVTDLLFGVKNDTIARTDTFCFVTSKDSCENCLAYLRFNRLWVVKFQIAGIDSSIVPWDTTWRVSSITDSILPDTQALSNQYGLTVMRKMELKKESFEYLMKSITGFTRYIPNSTDAPAISNVVLSRLNRVDTFYSGARMDKKGIYNPRLLDSLYTVAKDESITVKITTSTPSDTATDRNYFFVSCGMPYVTSKQNVSVSHKLGMGKIAFSTAGINHLYIEVIPASALFYPYRQWKSTTWAIPIRVTP